MASSSRRSAVLVSESLLADARDDSAGPFRGSDAACEFPDWIWDMQIKPRSERGKSCLCSMAKRQSIGIPFSCPSNGQGGLQVCTMQKILRAANHPITEITRLLKESHEEFVKYKEEAGMRGLSLFFIGLTFRETYRFTESVVREGVGVRSCINCRFTDSVGKNGYVMALSDSFS